MQKFKRSKIYIFSLILTFIFLIIVVWYPINIKQNDKLWKILMSNIILLFQLYLIIRGVFVPIFIINKNELIHYDRAFKKTIKKLDEIEQFKLGEGLKMSRIIFSDGSTISFFWTDVRSSDKQELENLIKTIEPSSF